MDFLYHNLNIIPDKCCSNGNHFLMGIYLLLLSLSLSCFLNTFSFSKPQGMYCDVFPCFSFWLFFYSCCWLLRLLLLFLLHLFKLPCFLVKKKKKKQESERKELKMRKRKILQKNEHITLETRLFRCTCRFALLYFQPLTEMTWFGLAWLGLAWLLSLQILYFSAFSLFFFLYLFSSSQSLFLLFLVYFWLFFCVFFWL